MPFGREGKHPLPSNTYNQVAPLVASSTQEKFYKITFPTVLIEQLPYL
jgi:hypothetical protein